jgi:hypothetical protein
MNIHPFEVADLKKKLVALGNWLPEDNCVVHPFNPVRLEIPNSLGSLLVAFDG